MVNNTNTNTNTNSMLMTSTAIPSLRKRSHSLSPSTLHALVHTRHTNSNFTNEVLAEMSASIPLTNELAFKDRKLLANLVHQTEHSSFVVASASSSGVVFASKSFSVLTGFSQLSIVTKNIFSVLGGFLDEIDETQMRGMDRIRTAIALQTHEAISSFVVLFKKDNSPFISRVCIRSLYNKSNAPVLLLFLFDHPQLRLEQHHELDQLMATLRLHGNTKNTIEVAINLSLFIMRCIPTPRQLEHHNHQLIIPESPPPHHHQVNSRNNHHVNNNDNINFTPTPTDHYLSDSDNDDDNIHKLHSVSPHSRHHHHHHHHPSGFKHSLQRSLSWCFSPCRSGHHARANATAAPTRRAPPSPSSPSSSPPCCRAIRDARASSGSPQSSWSWNLFRVGASGNSLIWKASFSSSHPSVISSSNHHPGSVTSGTDSILCD